MAEIHLPERAVITLAGDDAEHFLQNLITTDLDRIGPAEAWPGALLTPQGKVMFDFLISRTDTGFAIETHAEDAASLLQRLMLYKLRAKVTIAAEETDGVTVFTGDDAPDTAVTDMRFSPASITVKRLPGRHGNPDPEAYKALRIEAGVPEMHADYGPQDAFPHDLLFDRNGAVSFRKGCFVGQEVVSRMQHRGTARRRLVLVRGAEALPAAGTTIHADGKPAGELGSVAGDAAMAILRIDRAASAENLTAGDVAVTVTPYAWSGITLEPSGAEAE
ncbi:YgfZ/GcvT domain-containing protein [Martelella mediterranea]|uniref:tRNA-modifying protein YgfZ n=1 Tax=Martelella mediterranea DSM 17316 TaxID=1122214 RepID=A0A1U9Z2Y1_9HYPH|nr:folate-binding protein YgfZ [Martelella mediterranea]AQZ51962.1 tRNA-modifying protein YgfZ [Martelella mediterranea DSM 17316]